MQIKTHETAINLRNQQNKSMLVTFIVSRLSEYMQVTRLHHMQDLQISPPESIEGVASALGPRNEKTQVPRKTVSLVTSRMLAGWRILSREEVL